LFALSMSAMPPSFEQAEKKISARRSEERVDFIRRFGIREK